MNKKPKSIKIEVDMENTEHIIEQQQKHRSALRALKNICSSHVKNDPIRAKRLFSDTAFTYEEIMNTKQCASIHDEQKATNATLIYVQCSSNKRKQISLCYFFGN